MATIKDVARDAGVSVGTVSNVLNGGKVSAERRHQVEASIKKLDYQVNTLAKGMRMQKTDYVVVILPNLINPYFSVLLQHLENALSREGKQTILCLSGDDEQREEKFVEMAKANKIDGIIGITYSKIDKYLTSDMPFVSIDRRFGAGIPCVSSDNRMGGWLAAENLYRRGARSLLCFQMVNSLGREVRKRRKGFEEFCMEHEVTYSCLDFSEKQVFSLYSSFGSRTMINSILKAYVNNMGHPSVDGIFASTDHLAIVICEELKALGKRVPEDVQVVGFDGLRMLNQAEPLVSSIEQPTKEIAESSVKCLMQLLSCGTAKDVICSNVKFIEGGTTK